MVADKKGAIDGICFENLCKTYAAETCSVLVRIIFLAIAACEGATMYYRIGRGGCGNAGLCGAALCGSGDERGSAWRPVGIFAKFGYCGTQRFQENIATHNQSGHATDGPDALQKPRPFFKRPGPVLCRDAAIVNFLHCPGTAGERHLSSRGR